MKKLPINKMLLTINPKSQYIPDALPYCFICLYKENTIHLYANVAQQISEKYLDGIVGSAFRHN